MRFLVFVYFIVMLYSCDPTFYYKNGVTWRVYNDTRDTLSIKVEKKGEFVYSSVRDVEKGEFFYISRLETDSDVFDFPFDKISSVTIYTCYGDSINIEGIFFDKRNWNLEIKNGDEVYDKPFTSEYKFWYDYTFVITDSMLKK